MKLVPAALRGYDRAWLTRDIIAGLTLGAVAIPEVMGYTSIAGTPIVTGLYICPTLAEAFRAYRADPAAMPVTTRGPASPAP